MHRLAIVAPVFVAHSLGALAAVPISFEARTVFFGDNTEFFNPFRSGETTLGAHGTLSFAAAFSDSVRFSLGVFGLERFGSESAFELVRPVLQLRIGGDEHRFIFGTLETERQSDAVVAPGRTTLHGLLPPLQVETLALTRPYEAGAQWIVDTPRIRNELWLSWQKLNTPEHREQFDVGAAGRVRVLGPFHVAWQVHVVHHGGQQYRVGPVTDRLGFGPGLIVEPSLWGLDLISLELYGLYSKESIRDMSSDAPSSGRGLFARLTFDKSGWRGHAIAWHAADFVTEEGDRNYLSRRADDTPVAGARDYLEFGFAKLFRVVKGVSLEASALLHRVERYWEYSIRLLATVDLVLPVIE